MSYSPSTVLAIVRSIRKCPPRNLRLILTCKYDSFRSLVVNIDWAISGCIGPVGRHFDGCVRETCRHEPVSSSSLCLSRDISRHYPTTMPFGSAPADVGLHNALIDRRHKVTHTHTRLSVDQSIAVPQPVQSMQTAYEPNHSPVSVSKWKHLITFDLKVLILTDVRLWTLFELRVEGQGRNFITHTAAYTLFLAQLCSVELVKLHHSLFSESKTQRQDSFQWSAIPVIYNNILVSARAVWLKHRLSFVLQMTGSLSFCFFRRHHNYW